MSLSHLHNADHVKTQLQPADSKAILSGSTVALFSAPSLSAADFPGLAGKKIILGVTGGVAICKSPAIVTLLKSLKCDVQVVATDAAAQRFKTDVQAIQKASDKPILTSLDDEKSEDSVLHVDLANKADAILIAPVTANTIAKLIGGFGDNLLTTTCLVDTGIPIFLATAMNTDMWKNKIVQRNIEALEKLERFFIIDPIVGKLRCGTVGIGKMQDPVEILKIMNQVLLMLAMLKPITAKNTKVAK